eukprot:6970761-Alexandrium_andersonii.AAC.1
MQAPQVLHPQAAQPTPAPTQPAGADVVALQTTQAAPAPPPGLAAMEDDEDPDTVVRDDDANLP